MNKLTPLLAIILLSSCANKVVYYPTTAPVRLAKDIPNIRVLVPDETGELIEVTTTLKAGQYVLSRSSKQ